MNIKQQILVDKYIAKPVAYFLNFIVRLLGKLLHINHSLDKEFKTIVIAKFKGMGSIIQATPMINAIKNKYPNAEIIFVSTKANETMLKKITWIDTVVCIDDSSLIKFLSSNITSLLFLIKKRPEVYFDLEIYSDYSTLFTLFTLSTNRVGFYLRSSSFRMGIYTHMMFFNPRVPISNVYLQLSMLLGCATKNTTLYPLINDFNSFAFSKKDYIVINPNASDLRIERRWPKDKFVQLIQLVLNEYPSKLIFIIGSKAEKEYSEEITSSINNSRVYNTSGTTTIDGLIEIIKNAELMITNDTGPMHLAFCTETPLICLFGPCSPDQYGVSKNAHIIYKPVYCSPCVHDFEIAPCKGNNVCMQLISVNEVFDKVQFLLQNPQEQTPSSSGLNFIYSNNEDVLGKVIR
ncbi:MAG: hypothetical protein A3K10_12150 [Bacteroidetes bacterium RIFCSPLOWO2_12_FULL_31_6]|nr:MAG: hypothetical protein A3K10_12150 [Bacteroidetes bacterium RIFCSPLOWO2_12_FULL_31_6]